MDDNSKSKLEVSIGLSRKWDAREAGREVAKTAIKKLKTPPSFFLLFSTIHYKDHGGFQELLNGVWDVLPKGTPLIGGTVAGFINNYGCYARGVTSLAFSHSNMDIAVGIGRHTKRNPKKAVEHCAQMIKEGLKKETSKNKLLFNLISGPTIPGMPLMGRTNVIKSRYFGWLATHLGIKLFSYFGNGMGKEDEIVDQLTQLFSDYYIIGGSAMDDYKQIISYQFFNNEVYTNSIVAMGCNIDFPIFMKSLIGMHETEKTFQVTSSAYGGRLITKINKKPAKEYILKLLGITEEQYRNMSVFYYRTANYFPITFEENLRYTSGIAGFLGNSVALGYKIRGKNVRFLSITGKESLDLIDAIFQNNNQSFPFVFMPSSAMIINLLGNEAHSIKDRLDRYIKNIPYLMILTVNENAGTPDEPAIARVYSFNVMSLVLNDNKNPIKGEEFEPSVVSITANNKID